MGPIQNTPLDLEKMDAVVQDGRFSDLLRINCAGFGAYVAFSTGKSGYIDTHFIPQMDMLGERDALKGSEELLVDFCRKDSFSASDLSEWMDAAADALQPFDRRAVLLLNQQFTRLCRLGAVELAEKQIAAAKTFRFSADSNSSGFALQLQWRQELERVKELMPIHQVLQSFFETKLSLSYERPDYQQFAFQRETSLQDERRAKYALFQYRLYDHSVLGFWSHLNDFELSDGGLCVDQANLGSLLGKILEACQTDSQYSQAVELCSRLFDTDDPACREIFHSYAEALLRRPELKKTHQWLLWMKYRQFIRQGEHARVLVDLKSEKNLSSQQIHAFMMSVLLTSDDIDALNDYLNAASPDLLLEDVQLANTLCAYKLCGRDAEYEIFAKKGQEVLNEYMAASVQTGEHYPVYQALELIEQLPWPASYENWEHLVAGVAKQDTVAYMQMNLAHRREDWAALEIASRVLTKHHPLVYDNYFFLGKAFIKQRKYEEGVAALDIFLMYCKDLKEYPEAQELREFAEAQRRVESET